MLKIKVVKATGLADKVRSQQMRTVSENCHSNESSRIEKQSNIDTTIRQSDQIMLSFFLVISHTSRQS